MRYVIFGDTGGWEGSLYNSLVELGLDEKTKKLPEDIHVVHLGDLVHKGPYKNIVKDFQPIIEKNNWTQLIGNHEAQYLGGYEFWSPTIAKESEDILIEWFNKDVLKFMYSIKAGTVLKDMNGNVLRENSDPIVMTHAGIGKAFYDTYLFGTEPHEWNEMMLSLSPRDIYEVGRMLGKDKDMNDPVGPVWAHGVHEVWRSWLNTHPGFNQIVGHISPYLFESRMFFPGTNKMFKKVAELFPEERVAIVPFGNADNVMLFADPGYTENWRTVYQPYVIVEEL